MRLSAIGALASFAIFLAPSSSGAADSCTGDACAALTAATTPCAWTNKGDKSVRLSVYSANAGAALAILAPGETYKESNQGRCAGDVVPRLDARFVSLTPMPESVAAVKKPVPKAKPSPTAAATTPAPAAVATAPAVVSGAPAAATAAAPAAATPVAVAAVGSSPLPRAKPSLPPPYPPTPRVKPEAPAALAAAPAAVVAPTAPVVAAAPSASSGAPSCEEGCPPILFKVFDNCLWVLNLNPRPVAFEADASGKKISLALEAADGEKADARAATLKGGGPKDEAAVHMRFRDPFQSAGAGIPLFRARLGPAASCVKSREEIAHFTASYTK